MTFNRSFVFCFLFIIGLTAQARFQFKAIKLWGGATSRFMLLFMESLVHITSPVSTMILANAKKHEFSSRFYILECDSDICSSIGNV